MTVLAPLDLSEAGDALRAHPDAHVLAGGTDFMVEVNYAHRRPPAVIAVGRVAQLRGWRREGNTVHAGAALTYTEMAEPAFAAAVPALAAAARTVGSPQIRNAGTLGGNCGTGSPAGDTLPVLAALDATIELVDPAGRRRELTWDGFFLGPKRTALQPGELITAVRVPVVTGAQDYLKVGTRNAMVIAVASVAVVIDASARTVRVGLGSVGPTPLRAPEAEAWVAERLDWDGDRPPAGVAPALAAEFGSRVAAQARPIDDHRSSAAYRRHAVAVLARRGLERLLNANTSEAHPA